MKWTKYTKADIDFIKDNYTTMSNKELASKLGRTEYSIAEKIRELRMTKVITQEQIDFSLGIRRNPKRNMAFFLEKESPQIISLFKKGAKRKDIARNLGVSYTRVCVAIKRYENGDSSTKNIYSEDDLNFLKNNYLELSNDELAEQLGRSYDGIASKLRELGLKRKENVILYSTSEKEYIISNIGKKPVTEIAKDLGRTQSGVSKYIAKHRISNIRKRKKVYLENIDNDIVPFYSKSANYLEIIEQMNIGDSFEFPMSDKAIVINQKYEFVNGQKRQGNLSVLFAIRKMEVKEGIQMYRIWRLS